jgi:ribosome-associated heat shock protein Hsp15
MHQDPIRLDKWLVYARFSKTRAASARLIEAGIRINGRKIEKPDSKLHVGDVLTLQSGADICLIRVLLMADRRGSPQMARALYEILPQSGTSLE